MDIYKLTVEVMKNLPAFLSKNDVINYLRERFFFSKFILIENVDF